MNSSASNLRGDCSARARRALLVAAFALGGSTTGCELIVRFDESKLQDIPAVDAVRSDVASDSVASEASSDAAPANDAQPDAAADVTLVDSSPDSAPDAGPDVTVVDSSRDSAPDSAPDALPDSAPDASVEPAPEAGTEPAVEAGADASDDDASMGDAAMDASTD